MSNEIYEKNIKCLEVHSPMLLKEFIRGEQQPEGRPDDSVEIEVVEGRRGYPTFSIQTGDGEIIHGHSIFDPMREAEKKYGDGKFGEKDRIVLLGFGFGYEVRYLLTMIKHPIIVVVEPFVSVFRKALETVDLTDIFMTHRVIMSFSVAPQGIKYALATNATRLTTVPTYRAHALPHTVAFKEFIGVVSDAIKEMENFLTLNIATGLLAGPIIQNNIALNFKMAMRNPGVCMVNNCFEGRPIFVIAPGPSLEKNVEQLKRVKGKAFIIACDTAARPLLHYGVEPDGIISIDYQPLNFTKLRGVDTSFAYLFPALETTPYIHVNHKGRMFNYYHSSVSESMFGPILGPRGTIATGGSVLTDAFNLARLMGGDPIILVGVDLGFPGKKWYASGSFDGGKFTQDIRDGKHKIIEIEDINGDPMYTYAGYYEFLSWFGANIPLREDRVIDATEGGAKIEHAEIMTLSDAIDQFVTGDNEPPFDVLDSVYESYTPPDTGEVAGKIEEFISDFDDMRADVKKGLKNCRRAVDILKRSKALVNNKELIRLLKRINDARQILKSAEKEGHMNFIAPMMERQMAMISNLDDEDESIPKNELYLKMVEIDLNLYEQIEKASENMITHFEIIREEISLEYDEEFV